MDRNQLRRKLETGHVVVGTWVSIPHPIVVEAMASAGFDFFQVDGEHAPCDPDSLHHILPAAEAAGIPVVYRARRNRDDLISAALDAGVHAVMLPMVNSPEAAKAAVSAAKYPPDGRRGFGPWRASNYYREATAYRQEANASTFLAVQIEHIDAVRAADAIAAVKGVDLLYVGPADLALSMGLAVGQRHEDMDRAFKNVAEACRRHGKIAGTDIGDLELVAPLAGMGYSYFTYGADLSYLALGADEAAATFRRAVKP
jgi:2-keto-3-deoxy-L-rhamnonate aldolase RhmA